MAGASDKARFYLERAVPQLQEFEQKKIFSKVREFDASASRILTLLWCLVTHDKILG